MSKNKPINVKVTEQNGTLIFKPAEPRYNKEALLTQVLTQCIKDKKHGVLLIGSDEVVKLDPLWKTDVASGLANNIGTGAFFSRTENATYSQAFGAAQQH